MLNRVQSIHSPLLAIVLYTFLPSVSPVAAEERFTSQMVYVPSFSHILTQAGRSQPLASTLVIHNIDPQQDITISRIDYHDRTGRRLKSFVPNDVQLSPWESTNALVPIDTAGDGIGANFVVVWSSQSPVLAPVVEAVMIGGTGTQGISFTSRGRTISQTR